MRAFVKLALNGERITISQMQICLVSKEDFKKNSKYISQSFLPLFLVRLFLIYSNFLSDKSKADKYKEDEEKKREKSSKERKKKREKSRSRSRERKEEKRRKRHEEEASKSSERPPWIMPHLRVRVVDSKYKKGRFYKEKVDQLLFLTLWLSGWIHASGENLSIT